MVPGQGHGKVQAVVLKSLKPLLAHKLVVAQYQPDAVLTQQLHADLQQGGAIVGQLLVKQYLKHTVTHSNEREIKLTFGFHSKLFLLCHLSAGPHC